MSLPIRPELMARVLREHDAVQATFPGRFELRRDGRGRLSWAGDVPVEGRTFPVIATYPDAYPAVPPILETTLPLPPGCPHLLSRAGGRCRLCWIAANGQGRSKWDPQRHTAATALRAAQRWGLAFLVWQAIGLWPVPDAYSHTE